MVRISTLAVLALLVAPPTAPAAAQGHGDHGASDQAAGATQEGMPEGWLMRFDRSGAAPDMADFQIMEPGWHVKTGRAGAGIYWMPDMVASGGYTARTSYHLFSPASHAEAFGLFLGGQGLDDAEQRYVYFLVRQTGEYLIKRRVGDETENVVGWTAHDAIPVAPAGEQGPTRYDLAVRVGEDATAFMVNGVTVHTLPSDQLDTDGVVGLRINHMLDVHVEGFEVDEGA